MKRHIGKITNTGQKVVVVFMSLPEQADHALVVSTDNLPIRIEQAIHEVIESREGQSTPVLADILARRMMPDSGVNMLESLHNARLLWKVSVDNVTMCPTPSLAFPLRTILEEMGKLAPSAKTTPESHYTEKYNSFTNNLNAGNAEAQLKLAEGLLMEAELLQSEANRKREEAYGYAPNLRRPTVTQPVAPVLLEELNDEPASQE